MTLAGWIEILAVLAAMIGLAWPLGLFIADVFEDRRSFLTPLLKPVERGLYALAGVDPAEEQDSLAYAYAMLVFCAFCLLALYLIQRCQGALPYNPLSRPAVPPDLAFNTAISFVTNAN